MVHNGIEYGDMQLIAEVYDILHRAAGLPARELADIFAEWNDGELRSYLVEITARIFERTDETGKPLVDVILDEAQQKGTGKWMSQNAFDIGAPIPTMNAAVEARILSSLKSERVAASKVLRGPSPEGRGDRARLVEAARHALYASKITSDHRAWRCCASPRRNTATASILDRSRRSGGPVYHPRQPARGHPPRVRSRSVAGQPAAGRCIPRRDRRAPGRLALRGADGDRPGIPVPAMSSSLAYYNSYRSARLPANLTQAQRDYSARIPIAASIVRGVSHGLDRRRRHD